MMTDLDVYEYSRNDSESTKGVVRLTIDRQNVFEDSPTAIEIQLGGRAMTFDQFQEINCGGTMLVISPVRVDARMALRIRDAVDLRDALTRLIERATQPTEGT